MDKHATTKIGAGAIILDKKEGVLLVKKSYGETKNKWTFPEGYVEKRESPAEAIIREIYEELGAKIIVNKLKAILYTECPRGTFVYFIFDCSLKNKKQVRLNNDELDAYGFFEIKKTIVSKDIHPLVLAVLNKKTDVDPPKTARKYCLYMLS